MATDRQKSSERADGESGCSTCACSEARGDQNENVDQRKHLKFLITNEDELQATFAAFFRSMGDQMFPVQDRPGHVTVSSAMLNKVWDVLASQKGFYGIGMEVVGIWEIDLDDKSVTIPITVSVDKGLLESIDYFENEKNRVTHPRRQSSGVA